MSGKTIRLYLVDGSPTGILTAEIINWTGKVIVASRTQLGELAKRPELKRTGVYCLVGPDPEFPSRDRVYIGEGDNVLTRLVAHDKDEDKDFFTRVIIVISKDDNITKSHGRFLESRLISLCHVAGRASICNGTAPPCNLLPEPDVADMEYFLGQVKLIFPALGLNFLQPPPTFDVQTQATDLTNSTMMAESPKFVMKEGHLSAYGVQLDSQFVVLKGSPARKLGHENWTSYHKLRDQLVAEGKLVNCTQPDHYVFADNYAFDSPSAAAAVVAAGNRNGRTYWKVDSTGQTYAQWHDAKLPPAQQEE